MTQASDCWCTCILSVSTSAISSGTSPWAKPLSLNRPMGINPSEALSISTLLKPALEIMLCLTDSLMLEGVRTSMVVLWNTSPGWSKLPLRNKYLQQIQKFLMEQVPETNPEVYYRKQNTCNTYLFAKHFHLLSSHKIKKRELWLE